METQNKSFGLKYTTCENTQVYKPNSIFLTWEDLPGFTLEFQYYEIFTPMGFTLQKKNTFTMAISKLTGIYKAGVHTYMITDLSKPNMPRFYWDYTNESEEYSRDIYDFMMEILRMTILPRLREITYNT